MKALTIAYMTFRQDCRIEWFFDGLAAEIAATPDAPAVQVVVVDGMLWRADRKEQINSIVAGRFHVNHVPPKPTVWQGPHRLTQRDYFCAANARNTALALSQHPHVTFVDDLSVLMPGWLAAHMHAAEHEYVLCGMTDKRYNLVVESGRLSSYTDHPPGTDSRRRQLHGDELQEAPAQWLYGGTFSVPLEAALRVNGQDEICDSIGGEDYDFGVRLGRAGYPIRINPLCGTVESEELHNQQAAMIRLDKPAPGREDGPYSSNVLYHRLMRETDRIWTLGNEFNLRQMRDRVLAGESFPIPTKPTHHWHDGQPLSEM